MKAAIGACVRAGEPFFGPHARFVWPCAHAWSFFGSEPLQRNLYQWSSWLEAVDPGFFVQQPVRRIEGASMNIVNYREACTIRLN